MSEIEIENSMVNLRRKISMANSLCANKFSDRHFHPSAKFSSKKNSLRNEFILFSVLSQNNNYRYLKTLNLTMCYSERIYTKDPRKS